MTLGERIRKVRRALDLTQQEFAGRIGMKRNSIAQVEMGRNTSEQTISSICREFGVREVWLRTGEGAMFAPAPTSALDALAVEKNLTYGDYVFIEKFLKMKSESRQVIMEFMIEFSKDILADDGFQISDPAGPVGKTSANLPQEMPDAELHAELERQVAELERQNQEMAERLESLEKEDAEWEEKEAVARSTAPSQSH